MNAVHVQNQKHELIPLRNRDKPITQQDALPKSEDSLRYLPRRDLLSQLRHPLCHPTLADYQSTCIDEVETSIVDPDAIRV
ncbi:hypothetical protein V6N11_076892 [Hibiscus sabdariffa]|uniref:Uncharacterized protein n=1 Tax=Hibiscus sabdariffa TaxID=183260 RepID=A0ABR2TC27_9ROSI